jgi:hypothetical protein
MIRMNNGNNEPLKFCTCLHERDSVLKGEGTEPPKANGDNSYVGIPVVRVKIDNEIFEKMKGRE